MKEGEAREGRSVAETPTWAVATVITVMVAFGFFFHSSLKRCGKVKEKK
jgi:mlo protein